MKQNTQGRNLMCGRCIKKGAGNSSQQGIASGSSMKTSSIKRRHPLPCPEPLPPPQPSLLLPPLPVCSAWWVPRLPGGVCFVGALWLCFWRLDCCPQPYIFFLRIKTEELFKFTHRENRNSGKETILDTIITHTQTLFWDSWKSPWVMGPSQQSVAATLTRPLHFTVLEGAVSWSQSTCSTYQIAVDTSFGGK